MEVKGNKSGNKVDLLWQHCGVNIAVWMQMLDVDKGIGIEDPGVAKEMFKEDP